MIPLAIHPIKKQVEDYDEPYGVWYAIVGKTSNFMIVSMIREQISWPNGIEGITVIV